MSEATVAQTPQDDVEPTRDAPTFQPRFDIVETESELTLYGDLPGVDESKLDVRYENAQLVIRGAVSPRNEGTTFLRQEYTVGDFQRTFSIGESINAAEISAEVRNGVLVIHLPMTMAAKPARIEVKSV